MKASSVREAQQSLGIPILVFFLLTGFVLPEIIELIPESTGLRLLNTLDRIDPMGMLVTVSILSDRIGHADDSISCFSFQQGDR